jgi:tight adherence protein C
MILVIATALLVASTYLLLSGLTISQRQIALSVRRARRYGARDHREMVTRKSVNDRVLSPLMNRLAALTLRFLPKTDSQAIYQKLMAAGLARSMSTQMYLAVRGASVILPAGLGFLLAVSGALGVAGLLVGLGGAAVGFIGPDFYLNARIRSRREAMQAELPNVLDLLCVSVEAGLGFDAAIVKLSERMEGPLVDEFAMVLQEMRIGESRAAALKSMAERVDVKEVSQFCRALIQADQLGIALARIMRVQSRDMRVRRQLAAEERAMKAPVKMLFPTVLFIFPSIFVVALGPAALQLMNSFANN